MLSRFTLHWIEVQLDSKERMVVFFLFTTKATTTEPISTATDAATATTDTTTASAADASKPAASADHTRGTAEERAG